MNTMFGLTTRALALARADPDESGSARNAEASRAKVAVVLVRMGEPRHIACARVTVG
jgi:hypothetical protein